MKKILFATIIVISSCIPNKEYISIELENNDSKIVNKALANCPVRDSFLYYKLTNNSAKTFIISKSLFYSCPTFEPENVAFFKMNEKENNKLVNDGLLTRDLGGDFALDTIFPFKVSYFFMKKDVVNDWLSRSPFILVRLPFMKMLSREEGYFEFLLRKCPKDNYKIEKADTMLLPNDYIKRNILIG